MMQEERKWNKRKEKTHLSLVKYNGLSGQSVPFMLGLPKKRRIHEHSLPQKETSHN